MTGAAGRGAAGAGGIRVRIRLFASYAEAAGRDALEMALPAGAVAADVLAAVRREPWAARLPPSPAVAINLRYAKPDAALADGDEVAIIPPVAGG
ncbi:MAG TPA: MoaD/ThiS family protein [Gemmatimonadales bacterium]|nr:MoaD/ThiS family protein [Gemmatimonadales bacterium]